MMYGPLIKAVVVFIVVVGVAIGLIVYGSSLKQKEWDAAIAVQAIASAEAVIAAAQNTARIESEFQKKLDAQKIRTKIVTKEVVKYVDSPTTKCVLSPEFERVFDVVSGMHDPGTDGVPAATSPTGAPPLVSDAPLADATVLAAYQDAVTQLNGLWDTYAALRDWTRTSYALSKDAAGR